jgi:protein disulfide-isomerase A6
MFMFFITQCIVAKFNADEEEEFASKFDIEGYPTLKFFSQGNANQGEEFTGSTTGEELTEFLNQKCGTFRMFGGGLMANAGRQMEMDKLVKEFANSQNDVGRTQALKQAREQYSQEKQKWQSYYVDVMERVLKDPKGEFPNREMKRLESMLKDKTSVQNIHPHKLDEITIRHNILMSFVQPLAK